MIKGYKISSHLINERADRVAAIAQYIGFGEIKYRFPTNRNTVEAITTTGILIVLSKREKIIITMYLLTFDKATSLFNGNIPNDLYAIIKKNSNNKGYAKYA